MDKTSPVPFACPWCGAEFGTCTPSELVLNQSAAVRSRTVLTCRSCGRKRSWRPAEKSQESIARGHKPA